MQKSFGVDALSVGFHPTIIKRYSKEIKVDLFNPSANKYGTFSTKLSITVCLFLRIFKIQVNYVIEMKNYITKISK